MTARHTLLPSLLALTLVFGFRNLVRDSIVLRVSEFSGVTAERASRFATFPRRTRLRADALDLHFGAFSSSDAGNVERWKPFWEHMSRFVQCE